MKTIGEILPLSARYLQEHGVKTARRDAEEIVAWNLRIKRIDLYLRFDYPLQEEELISTRAMLKRRAKGEPVEYILGEVEFFDCKLLVNSSVLIPRVETEILLSKICAQLKGLQGKKAWDLCTGSGCLGIGLKKRFPELEVSVSDISPKALEVAKQNAERNGTNINFLLGDLFVPFAGLKADVIVCNPPYISKKEYESLDLSVKMHEPKEALIGGEEGVEFYRRLSNELPVFLNPKALVFLEIGWGQGKLVSACFVGGPWTIKALEKDWAGHDRFFFLEFE
jgi:release factor glutamine methyltransferase